MGIRITHIASLAVVGISLAGCGRWYTVWPWEPMRPMRLSGTPARSAMPTAASANSSPIRAFARHTSSTVPVSGADTLLKANEIRQLIAFADEIPKSFPQLGEDGKPVAADVEFAFVGGRLWLLQIRPFNESRQARGANYLIQMDKALQASLKHNVSLKEAIR